MTENCRRLVTSDRFFEISGINFHRKLSKEAAGNGISTTAAGSTVTAIGLSGFLDTAGFLFVASDAKGGDWPGI